jgi:hypothetical protein
MSYKSQALLVADGPFQMRVNAALMQQMIFSRDQPPPVGSLANDVIMNRSGAPWTFYQLVAAAPGFADKVETEDGMVDSSRLTDAEILAGVQPNIPFVAGLFYPATPAG